MELGHFGEAKPSIFAGWGFHEPRCRGLQMQRSRVPSRSEVPRGVIVVGWGWLEVTRIRVRETRALQYAIAE